MKFSVAHAAGSNSFWQEFELDEALTAEQAILQSGLLEQFPDLDIQKLKIGIFGKVCKTSQMVQEGDRIEVYLPATAKPADAEEES